MLSGASAQKNLGTGEADKATGVYELGRQATVQVLFRTGANFKPAAAGSGVWLNNEGYIATCSHVIAGLPTGSTILIGIGDAHYYTPNISIDGARLLYKVDVLASDKDSDVAILKTHENLFEHPPVPLIEINGKSESPVLLSPVSEADAVPNLGAATILSGFPLDGTRILFQSGTFAGFTVAPSVMGLKQIRFLLSLTSNPGNSGGPVLNSDGKLVGLLEGNLGSPNRDEKNRQTAYLRPKRDDAGNPVLDANGQPAIEEAPLFDNSGISVVVPARLVFSLLDSITKKSK